MTAASALLISCRLNRSLRAPALPMKSRSGWKTRRFPLMRPTPSGSACRTGLPKPRKAQAAFGDAGIASDAPSPTLVESGDASGNQGSEDALADLKSAFGDAGSGPEAQPVLVETGASPSDHGSEDALSELEPAVGELAMDLAMSPAEGKTGLQADAEPIKAPEATGQPALAKAPEAPEASASSPVASAPEQASASAPSAAAGDESSGKRGRPAQDKEGRGKNKSRGRKPGSLLSL